MERDSAWAASLRTKYDREIQRERFFMCIGIGYWCLTERKSAWQRVIQRALPKLVVENCPSRCVVSTDRKRHPNKSHTHKYNSTKLIKSIALISLLFINIRR